MKVRVLGWLSMAAFAFGAAVCIVEGRWAEACMLMASSLEAARDMALAPPEPRLTQLPAKDDDEEPPQAA